MESGGSGTEGGGSDEKERRQKAVEASFEDPVPDEGQPGERIKDQAVEQEGGLSGGGFGKKKPSCHRPESDILIEAAKLTRK